jgi:hypothetical protein
MAICSMCGEEYVVPKRHDTWLHYGHHFCGVACIMSYIEQYPRDGDSFRLMVQIGDLRPDPGHAVYSPYTQKTYRSEYERTVGEFLEWRWDGMYSYEQHGVILPGAVLYIPDFVVGGGVALEVKGEWRLGARKKFLAAQEILGEDRLILLGPQYQPLFRVPLTRFKRVR